MIKEMPKNYKGFTLIEVLVAVGVLSVASLAFLPSFSKANKEKNLQQNSETVKDALANARNRALTEVGNPGSSSKYVYSGVKFVIDSSDVIYFRSTEATSGACNAVDPSKPATFDSIKVLSNNVVTRIATADSPTCLFFEYGTGNAFVTKGYTGTSANANICTN